MPDYFTHCAVAQHVFNNLIPKLKSKIISPTLYLLGAQGGDIFYTCNMGLKKGNLGTILHKSEPINLFKKLALGNESYVAGFATHYALDCTFHPVVYAIERHKFSPLAHYNVESDLGLYVCARLNSTRKILPRERVLGCAYAVYDSVKNVTDGVTLAGVEKCLKRHCSSTEFLYRTRRITYRYDYDYRRLAPLLDRAIKLAERAVECVLNKDINEDVFNKSFLNKDLNN